MWQYIKKYAYAAVIIIVLGVFFIQISSKFNKQIIYLYAWERPEDFSFLSDNKSNVGIVFYARDIVIKDKKVAINLRRNPLVIPSKIKSSPLIRIDNFDTPEVLQDNLATIADAIKQICASYTECQIDFEAKTSEYKFYSELLSSVHNTLPDTKIYITALASWCSGKSWFDDASFYTAVPMLYRMGKDGPTIKSGRVGTWFLSNSSCSDNIALSTDEFDFNPQKYMRGKSVYIFNPEPWTTNSYKKALAYLGI